MTPSSSDRPSPNLFVVGAMKSGTSSLHNYLVAHPSVFMSLPKEPSYFVERRQLRSIWPEGERRGIWRSIDNYLDLFSTAGDAIVIGESSTNYAKLPRLTGVPQRIAAFNPDARIIYIMRDPVERTISHYWHNVYARSEHRSLLKAIKRDGQYREVSHYAMQLSPYLELFGREHVMTLTLENLQMEPLETVRSLWRWLGVDSSYEPRNLNVRANVTDNELSRARGLGLLRRLATSPFWEPISPWIPKGLRTAAKRLSEGRVVKSDVSTRNAVDYLRPTQRSETEELSRMLEIHFPEWTTLYGNSP